MGAFLEMPDGSCEWVEEVDYPKPLDWSDALDPAFDFYPDANVDPQPVYVPRAVRVGGRLRKQAS